MAAAEPAQVIPLSTRRPFARKSTSTKDRITLPRLQGMSYAQLDRLYSQLSPPDTLSSLNGRKRGYVLSIAGLHRTPLGRVIDVLGQTPFFPWRGISFSARSLINRINLTITRQEWFAFQTGFKTSHVDGRPCVHMNYGLKGNPWLIRQLSGELREVEPGLYLGVALLKTSKGSVKLLYFAISH